MPFNVSNIRSDASHAKSEQVRRRLRESVDAERAHFIQLAEAFYAKDRRTESDYRQLCDALIGAAQRILSAEDWNTSLFLRNTLKSIKNIYEEALVVRGQLDAVHQHASMMAPVLTEDAVKLYISLYQSNGHDLANWALQLASLPHYVIGRPIYDNEADVLRAIRLKPTPLSEAYVMIAVDRGKVVAAETVRKDRFGHVLINILPDAIKSENIMEFVHRGHRYHYAHKSRELVLKSDRAD